MLILTSGRLDRRLAGSRTGMTLVELLTVIAVISILIGILIPTVSTVRTSARKAKAKILLNQWAAGIETFRQEYGFYPAFSFNTTDQLINSTEDTAEFVKALAGRNIDGSKIEDSNDLASGNRKRITFYTFSEGEISEADELVDVFEKTPIAVLMDLNYDGIIRVETGEGDDDYIAWPDLGSGHGANAPFDWPDDGLRAGVAIYSPGPEEAQVISSPLGELRSASDATTHVMRGDALMILSSYAVEVELDPPGLAFSEGELPRSP